LVVVASRDRPRRVDAGGIGVGGTWGIERGEGAVASPQEAGCPNCGLVLSRDRPRRVDAGGFGAIEGTWGIEFDEGAVAPQKAVTHYRWVFVVSRDRPRRVDAGGRGANAGTWASNVVKVPLLARRKPWPPLVSEET
jgi:hypothetical protein